jgi:hypothetical protein
MTDMKYVRLFAGPDGETHFEDEATECHWERQRSHFQAGCPCA